MNPVHLTLLCRRGRRRPPLRRGPAQADARRPVREARRARLPCGRLPRPVRLDHLRGVQGPQGPPGVHLPAAPLGLGAMLNLGNFRKLFEPRASLQGTIVFWQYLLNSLFLSSAATVIQVFFCSLGGYALAKFRFTGRRDLMLFMAGSLMLPSMLFLAPTYDMMVHIGLDRQLCGPARAECRERIRDLPLPPGDAERAQQPDRGGPRGRRRRVPHLLAHRDAARPADDRGVLPHRVHGAVEHVPRAPDLHPVRLQAHRPGHPEPVRLAVPGGVRYVPRRNLHIHLPDRRAFPDAPEGVHLGADHERQGSAEGPPSIPMPATAALRTEIGLCAGLLAYGAVLMS